MRRRLSLAVSSLVSLKAMCEARFPKPDFTSGYQYPDIEHGVPLEWLWNVVDIVLRHLSAYFQRIARGDKKAFFSDQCKEIEENNRMGRLEIS